MSSELPVFHALKTLPKSFVAGHPRQLVDLLSKGTATAIVKSSVKENGTFYELLLRCPILAPDVNLPVYICLDHLNMPLTVEEDKQVTFQAAREDLDITIHTAVDEDRLREWNECLELALSFWALKMEEVVRQLYPDRSPKQVDRYATSAVVEMKLWKNGGAKPFDVHAFLAQCRAKKGFPCMKLSYGWVGSKEDPRSRDHIWGLKFDFSNYAQYPVVPRSRKPVSTAERQEQLLKKRKEIESNEELDASLL